MYQIEVNNKYNFGVIIDNEQIKIDNDIIQLDQINLTKNSSHVLYQNKSYTIEIVEFIKEDKTAIVKVNGSIYTLKIQDQYDQLLKQLGLDNLAASKIQQIKAPMPGIILNVLVKENEQVKEGDVLLILEAMKMENSITSPKNGIIKKIKIAKSSTVEKGQLLIELS